MSARPTHTYRTARLRSPDEQHCVEFYWRIRNVPLPAGVLPPVNEERVVVHVYATGASHDLPPIISVSAGGDSDTISSGEFHGLSFANGRALWRVLLDKGWTEVKIVHATDFGKRVLERQDALQAAAASLTP